MPGGFVGVDVFFVISGYLISLHLLDEVFATGTINLREFYGRRIRRLLPAFVVVALTTLALGAVMLLPILQEQARLAYSAIYAAVFLSNVEFARTGGYFDPATELKPLLHTWSLAVEEQFYLMWPLALLGLAALSRVVPHSIGHAGGRRARRGLPGLVGLWHRGIAGRRMGGAEGLLSDLGADLGAWNRRRTRARTANRCNAAGCAPGGQGAGRGRAGGDRRRDHTLRRRAPLSGHRGGTAGAWCGGGDRRGSHRHDERLAPPVLASRGVHRACFVQLVSLALAVAGAVPIPGHGRARPAPRFTPRRTGLAARGSDLALHRAAGAPSCRIPQSRRRAHDRRRWHVPRCRVGVRVDLVGGGFGRPRPASRRTGGGCERRQSIAPSVQSRHPVQTARSALQLHHAKGKRRQAHCALGRFTRRPYAADARRGWSRRRPRESRSDRWSAARPPSVQHSSPAAASEPRAPNSTTR